jgi:hypothetical protein
MRPAYVHSGVAASALASLQAKAGAGSRIRTDDLLITNPRSLREFAIGTEGN